MRTTLRKSVMRRSKREEESTQAPAPPLGALVTGHVRELQLLLAVTRSILECGLLADQERVPAGGLLHHSRTSSTRQGARLKW